MNPPPEVPTSRPTSIGRQRTVRQRFFSGWRCGAAAASATASTVCLFNIIITIWVWKTLGYRVEGDIGTLYEGSCQKTKSADRWVHLAINTLSTILLASSNYCMQILSSPNRDELVNAHAKRYWLHIGVPSIRNLLRIGRDRSSLWLFAIPELCTAPPTVGSSIKGPQRWVLKRVEPALLTLLQV